jgi:hypothetical protein
MQCGGMWASITRTQAAGSLSRTVLCSASCLSPHHRYSVGKKSLQRRDFQTRIRRGKFVMIVEGQKARVARLGCAASRPCKGRRKRCVIRTLRVAESMKFKGDFRMREHLPRVGDWNCSPPILPANDAIRGEPAAGRQSEIRILIIPASAAKQRKFILEATS